MATGATHTKFFVFGEIPRNFVDKVLSVIKDFVEAVEGLDYRVIGVRRSLRTV